MIELIPTVVTSFLTSMSANAVSKAQGPAQALDDVMTLCGFEKLHLIAEKKRAIYENNLKSFKEDIAQEIIQIPEENIQDPKMSIVGPALEASKYFIEEKEIREMFAKIVAGSMNSELSPLIHHSFVEVIKQLSKDDAVFLNEFISNTSIPSLILYFTNSNKSDSKTEESSTNNVPPSLKKINFPVYNEIKTLPYIDMYYISKNCDDINKNIFVLSNLIRLGIVEFKKNSLVNEELYNFQIEQFEKLKTSNETKQILKGLNTKFDDFFTVKNKLALIELTPFGQSFCEICL